MFNPIIASENIKKEFISYISTSFPFFDSNLKNQFENQLKEMISKGPYLEINDVFVQGASIKDLINDGILSPLFFELEKKKVNNNLQSRIVLPIERKLYLHQEQAIKKIVSNENVIISTGTGSGKTNCFLIPIINELLREKESGTLGPGIRALFIYPMNALANDQLKNIRKLLMDFEDITFGVYSGATEFDEDEAIKVYESMFASESIEKLRTPLKNEFLSREKMKQTPPNILFTNYAMLEHLLFRPNDDILFSKSNFKFVVLDEAHVYSGATGIETSLLLRRLKARINKNNNVQFILTSATLGDGNESNDNIVTFARNLCGEDFKVENIIRASREKYDSKTQGIHYSYSLICELANEENSISQVLDKNHIQYDKNKEENELIYDIISSSEQYQIFREALQNDSQEVLELDRIKEILNANSDECVAFISLCSRAFKNGKSLLDARYHFFVRCLEGCYITLTPEIKLFLNRKKFYENYNSQVFEIAICNDCGKYALVGKIYQGYLVQASKIDEEVEYFYLDEDSNDEINDEDDSIKEKYYLCPHCGAIIEESSYKNQFCEHNQDDYIKIVRAKRPNNDLSNKLPKCGNCHRGRYNRFYLGNDAATSVLATALFEELPEFSYEEIENSNPSNGNIFTSAITNRQKNSKRKISQFLVFSDSRQEAAKFACYLEKSYNEFLRRRGI